jgi:hypothetical protein
MCVLGDRVTASSTATVGPSFWMFIVSMSSVMASYAGTWAGFRIAKANVDGGSRAN